MSETGAEVPHTIKATGLWPETRRPTSLGLGVTVSEQVAGDGSPRYADLLAASRLGADIGFEALWYADHFSFESEKGLRGSWDVWTLMAAIAAQVPDVQIGSMVACTAYRNPGVIAKMTEMIDEISGGRFILGLGSGWNKPEYEQFGLPFEPRVTRFEEAIEIIQGLLRDGEADVQGQYYQANKAKNLPRGPRPDGAPILIGSSGPRMLGILARYADAWNTGWGNDTRALKQKIAVLETACAEMGRDPATVIRTVGVVFAAEGFAGVSSDAFNGSDEEKLAVLVELEELGFRHIKVNVQPYSIRAIEAVGPVVDAFYNRSRVVSSSAD
jgi:alkanesulfonate monooxygenase SsuD/methylene tetrahydromethanopterin reductase-like flavin-dependent oxidoreductase (luciferase family)